MRIVTKVHLDKAKKDRDVEFLLGIVKDNPEMTQELRNYLVEILSDLINRKIRRPAHRPAKTATEVRRHQIATRALQIEEQADRKKMSESVAETAKEFGVSVSLVWGCLSKYRKEIEEAWRYAEAAEQSFEKYPADWEPDFDDWNPEPEFTDEEIEEAGEQYIQMQIDIARGK
jgi:hypothetical protein